MESDLQACERADHLTGASWQPCLFGGQNRAYSPQSGNMERRENGGIAIGVCPCMFESAKTNEGLVDQKVFKTAKKYGFDSV